MQSREYIKSVVAVTNCDGETFFRYTQKVNKEGFAVLRFNNIIETEFGTVYTSEWIKYTESEWVDGVPTTKEYWSEGDVNQDETHQILLEALQPDKSKEDHAKDVTEAFHKGILFHQTRMHKKSKKVEHKYFINTILDVAKESFYNQVEYATEGKEEDQYTEWK